MYFTLLFLTHFFKKLIWGQKIVLIELDKYGVKYRKQILEIHENNMIKRLFFPYFLDFSRKSRDNQKCQKYCTRKISFQKTSFALFLVETYFLYRKNVVHEYFFFTRWVFPYKIFKFNNSHTSWTSLWIDIILNRDGSYF